MKTIPISASPARVPGRRRVSAAWLVEAPHRLYFFTGTVLLVLALSWWAAAVAATWLGWGAPPRAVLPPGWMHAMALLAAVLPAYVFGFALTAMPRWLGRPPVPARAALPAALLHLAGGASLVAGFAAGGLAVLSAAWGLAVWLVVVRAWSGPHPDKRHATLIVVALVAGALAVMTALVAVVADHHGLARAALVVLLWGMLMPVNLVVAHRMLPFFTASAFPGWLAWRPFAPLNVLLAAVAGFGIATEAGAHTVAAVLALAAAAVTGWFSWRWQVRGLFGNRLLAMLHVSHAWLPFGFGLAAIQQVALAAGQPLLAHAPLHALTLGFLLSTAVAMVSRVSLGHSGRHVSSDRLTWALFWLLQATAVLRVAADFPGLARATGTGYVLAAGLAALVALTWAARYLPLYLSARADGLPG